jgi:hypothetical protein
MQNTGGPGLSTFATNQVEPGRPKPRQNMMPGAIETAMSRKFLVPITVADDVPGAKWTWVVVDAILSPAVVGRAGRA